MVRADPGPGDGHPAGGAGAGLPAVRMVGDYRVTAGDGRSTEELVEAGGYGYAHSCVISENFPITSVIGGSRGRVVALIEFDAAMTTEATLAAACAMGLARPFPEDALRFGIEHPDVQHARPIVFLHEPWLGYFGRRDVLCLWSNAGRRELGLEDFDGTWSSGIRFAFVRETTPGGS